MYTIEDILVITVVPFAYHCSIDHSRIETRAATGIRDKNNINHYFCQAHTLSQIVDWLNQNATYLETSA